MITKRPVAECLVFQPEGFIPQNDEQDINIMRPIFNEFDELDYEFNQYDKKITEQIKKHRDWNTGYFYLHHNVLQNGEYWDTLARWRYPNEAIYNRFLFWRLFTSKITNASKLNQT